jgi:DNA-binding Xre family transcriptional regulator
MPIVWNLKKWLAMERDIYRPSELQLLLAQKAGVELSIQAISSLINGKPNALRLQTIQALCNALDCKLSDFCEVLPDSTKEQQKQRKVAGDTPKSKRTTGRASSPIHISTQRPRKVSGAKGKRARREVWIKYLIRKHTTSTWSAALMGRSILATPSMSSDALLCTMLEREDVTPDPIDLFL